MKAIIVIVALMVFSPLLSKAQTEVEIDGYRSMSITGKGPGQDAAINPYDGEDCYAIVENTGKGELSIRIQNKSEIIDTIPLLGGDTKRVKLLSGYQLYIDSESEILSKAKIDFAKVEP